ncbi:MAG: folylpolyglutamate synthase/dihydrofolate synthase family protein [Thermodesulfobacteriota bacterium]
MNYQEVWQYLDDLQFFKIKLGLDSMTAFLDQVGNPQEQLSFVHVAGTNGKGSVAMNLLTILGRAGYRVGLFTSPHLSCVRERFRVNDTFISEEDFARHGAEICAALGEEQITYFEFTTALGLLWFAAKKVDLVILEVGMGGRLDATNVVTPLVGVITNVSMDHEAYLGDTLAEVAGEKAGIIKAGVPLVSGVSRQDDSGPVVMERCEELAAPLYLLGRDFSWQGEDDGWRYEGRRRSLGDLHCGMRGNYQRDNSSLALAVLDCLAPHGLTVSDEQIRQGLAEVNWPGRLEYLRQDAAGRLLGATGAGSRYQYLLDGAHNPAGMASLVASLASDFSYQRLICVWAAMADKDIASNLATIAPFCAEMIFTRPESERSATPGELAAALPPDYKGRSRLVGDVPAALAQARELAGPDDLILVAGSLYLVGAARLELCGELVG